MTATDPSPIPVPRRYYYLKRLGLFFTLWLLLLVGLRWYWGYAMHDRLEREIQAIAARGEPIRFEDMKFPAVPQADNQAYYYAQALNLWPRINGKLVTESDWYQNNEQHFPENDPVKDNQDYLAQCEPAFQALRQAAQATRCDWGVRPSHPVYLIPYPELTANRQRMQLLKDAMIRAHQVGNDALAVTLFQQTLNLAEANEKPFLSLIHHLISLSIRNPMLNTLAEILPTLRVGEQPEEAVSPAMLRALQARLLKEEKMRQGQARALLVERWAQALAVQELVNGQLTSSMSGPATPNIPWQLVMWTGGPIFENDIRLSLKHMTKLASAAEAGANLPDFQRRWKNSGAEAELNSMSRLSRMLAPALEGSIRPHYYSLAQSRLAATAIAIKLYELDHGRRPAQLAELVPQYLPAIPLDPMTDGQPIKYLPQGVTPVIPTPGVPGWSRNATPDPKLLPTRKFAALYCIGSNGTDQGGKCYFDEVGRIQSTSSDYDIVFLLDSQPDPIRPPKPGAPFPTTSPAARP